MIYRQMVCYDKGKEKDKDMRIKLKLCAFLVIGLVTGLTAGGIVHAADPKTGVPEYDVKNTANLEARTGLSVLEMGRVLSGNRYVPTQTVTALQAEAAPVDSNPALLFNPQMPATPALAVQQNMIPADIEPAAGQPQSVNVERFVIGNTDTGVDIEAMQKQLDR